MWNDQKCLLMGKGMDPSLRYTIAIDPLNGLCCLFGTSVVGRCSRDLVAHRQLQPHCTQKRCKGGLQHLKVDLNATSCSTYKGDGMERDAEGLTFREGHVKRIEKDWHQCQLQDGRKIRRR